MIKLLIMMIAIFQVQILGPGGRGIENQPPPYSTQPRYLLLNHFSLVTLVLICFVLRRVRDDLRRGPPPPYRSSEHLPEVIVIVLMMMVMMIIMTLVHCKIISELS